MHASADAGSRPSHFRVDFRGNCCGLGAGQAVPCDVPCRQADVPRSQLELRDSPQGPAGPLPWMGHVRGADGPGQGLLTYRLPLTDNRPPLQRASRKTKRCNWGGDLSQERGRHGRRGDPQKRKTLPQRHRGSPWLLFLCLPLLTCQ